ncbi:MAG: sigma-70 family RNA polymerase sigma factor [bacterium]|nr:sigma-70 family RNA polymerase sigma factor [bacterium]
MDSVELELVKRAKKKDINAFEQLFYRYQKRIYNYILGMIRDTELSSELTQDTFLRAYHSLSQLKKEEAFTSWLHRIAINLVRDKLRKHELNTESIDTPDINESENKYSVEIPDWAANPREISLQDELNRKIHKAISSLPPSQREVVILYHLEGYDIQEISRMIDAPSGTVKSRLARAREILKQKLINYIS